MDVAGVALLLSVAIAAGLVGCYAVMRRMALAGDAISHVALPGIGLAIALGVHPLLGALSLLLLGALLVWSLERRTRMPTETVIGVVFSTALAIGSLTSSGEELIEALFGGERALGAAETTFGIAGSVSVIAFVLARRDRLVLRLVSADVARTAGVDVARLDLEFLLAFSLAVGLGLRYLGVLLMGSLVIIPAASAKRVARTLTQMLTIAGAVAAFSTSAGSLLADQLGRPTGAVIVCVAAACFLASLLVGGRR